MGDIYLWKIYCETEDTWVEAPYPAASGTLTVCPNDSGHTVTLNSAAIANSDYGDIVGGQLGQVLVADGEGGEEWTYLTDAIEEDNYLEKVYDGIFVSEIHAYRDSGKTFKTYDEYITRTGGFVTQIVRDVYDSEDGITKLYTYTTTYERTNGVITSETVVRS